MGDGPHRCAPARIQRVHPAARGSPGPRSLDHERCTDHQRARTAPLRAAEPRAAALPPRETYNGRGYCNVSDSRRPRGSPSRPVHHPSQTRARASSPDSFVVAASRRGAPRSSSSSSRRVDVSTDTILVHRNASPPLDNNNARACIQEDASLTARALTRASHADAAAARRERDRRDSDSRRSACPVNEIDGRGLG